MGTSDTTYAAAYARAWAAACDVYRRALDTPPDINPGDEGRSDVDAAIDAAQDVAKLVGDRYGPAGDVWLDARAAAHAAATGRGHAA